MVSARSPRDCVSFQTRWPLIRVLTNLPVLGQHGPGDLRQGYRRLNTSIASYSRQAKGRIEVPHVQGDHFSASQSAIRHDREECLVPEEGTPGEEPLNGIP